MTQDTNETVFSWFLHTDAPSPHPCVFEYVSARLLLLGDECGGVAHSTVTDLARFLGQSTS